MKLLLQTLSTSYTCRVLKSVSFYLLLPPFFPFFSLLCSPTLLFLLSPSLSKQLFSVLATALCVGGIFVTNVYVGKYVVSMFWQACIMPWAYSVVLNM